MILVDEITDYPSRPFGYRKWSHLWDSENDLEALHAFAAQIGLRRAWFQDKRPLPHYDVTPSKRALALRLGATPESMFTWMRERVRRQREA